MKRLAMMIGCMMLLASPAMAISEFGKQWKNEYLGDEADEDFKKNGRKAGCYVCHVKGEDKKKVRNEYGKALHEFLKAEDFPKEYIKDNPEEAKAKILEGFKKAGEKKSSDGKSFAEKIEANELPATDSGL
ncbi:hypothetical protein Poly51_41710 [Rubripirellula tenax]|uniref:Cytochrome c domain-containing protein n=1 Tax=Rubripirellula tenax TaxID=2528015 RepID=A0A5C6EPP3_9BACT|nr:hypothetical protein [Rubripirellula tenax]TWU50878.1 hypothetical protein Poly51_41710 [Rubripirellula tenax]